MTTAGARCPRLVTPDRLGGQHPLCDACTCDLLDRLLRNPRWREYVVARLARDEVDQARGAAEAAATREAIEQRERTAEARAVEREVDAVHVVYYVRTGDHSIKIGTTGHLTERMRAFRVANPDNLLATEPGGYDLEQRRHHQFRAWRYHRRREDFGDGDDLLEHIATVRAEHGDPWTVGGSR